MNRNVTFMGGNYSQFKSFVRSLFELLEGNKKDDCPGSDFDLCYICSLAAFGYIEEYDVQYEVVTNESAYDQHFNNPLHYAAAFDQLEMVEYILRNQPEFNTRNKLGLLPEDIASMCGSTSSYEYLKKYGIEYDSIAMQPKGQK